MAGGPTHRLMLFAPADAGGRRWREVQCAGVALDADGGICLPADFELEIPESGSGRLKFLLTVPSAGGSGATKHGTPVAELDIELQDLMATDEATVSLPMRPPRVRRHGGLEPSPMARYPVLHLSLMGLRGPGGHWHGFSNALPKDIVAGLLVANAASRATLEARAVDRWGRIVKAEAEAREELYSAPVWEGTATVDESSAGWAARHRHQIALRSQLLPPPPPVSSVPLDHLTRVAAPHAGRPLHSFSPLALDQPAAAVHDGHWYVFGGLHRGGEENEVYRLHLPPVPPATLRWQRMETTHQVPLGRHGHTFTCWGNAAFVIGGIGLGGTIPPPTLTRSDVWAQLLGRQSPNRRRSNSRNHSEPEKVTSDPTTPTSAAPRRRPFPSGFVPDVYCLDLNRQAWRLVAASEAVCITEHSAVVFGDEILVFGGVGADLTPCATLRAFHCATYRWRVLSDQSHGTGPSARWGHTAVAFHSQMVVFGGRTAAGYSAETFVYDTRTSTWQQLLCANRPVGRTGHSATVHRESLYVVGGYGADGDLIADVLVLDLRSQTWQRVVLHSRPHPPPTPVAHHVACVAGSDTDPYLVVFGGRVLARPPRPHAEQAPPPPSKLPRSSGSPRSAGTEATDECAVWRVGRPPPPAAPPSEPPTEESALPATVQQSVNRLFGHHRLMADRRASEERARQKKGKVLERAELVESLKRLYDNGRKQHDETLRRLLVKYDAYAEEQSWTVGLGVPTMRGAAAWESWERDTVAKLRESKELKIGAPEVSTLVQRLYDVQRKRQAKARLEAEARFPRAGGLSEEDRRRHAEETQALQAAVRRLNRRAASVPPTPLATLAAPLQLTAPAPLKPSTPIAPRRSKSKLSSTAPSRPSVNVGASATNAFGPQLVEPTDGAAAGDTPPPDNQDPTPPAPDPLPVPSVSTVEPTAPVSAQTDVTADRRRSSAHTPPIESASLTASLDDPIVDTAVAVMPPDLEAAASVAPTGRPSVDDPTTAAAGTPTPQLPAALASSGVPPPGESAKEPGEDYDDSFESSSSSDTH